MVNDLIGLFKQRVERAETLTVVAILLMILNTVIMFTGAFYISKEFERLENNIQIEGEFKG